MTTFGPSRETDSCVDCGGDISDRCGNTLYCDHCRAKRDREHKIAYRLRLASRREKPEPTELPLPAPKRKRVKPSAHWRLDTPLVPTPDAVRDSSPKCIDCGALVALPTYCDTLRLSVRCARCRDLLTPPDTHAIVEATNACDSFLRWQREAS